MAARPVTAVERGEPPPPADHDPSPDCARLSQARPRSTLASTLDLTGLDSSSAREAGDNSIAAPARTRALRQEVRRVRCLRIIGCSRVEAPYGPFGCNSFWSFPGTPEGPDPARP